MQQDQAFLVGTTYEVPCIPWGGGVYAPVHLPIHCDPDLGAPEPHVHLDLRFVSFPELARGAVADDPFARALLTLFGAPAEALLLGKFGAAPKFAAPTEAFLLRKFFFKIFGAEPQDIVMRSMVCQRQMPPYPRHLAGWLQEGSPFSLPYRDLCPSSNRCPHKGLPLFTGADGRRHCPGHGLCFERHLVSP